MEQYINKSALVAEIKEMLSKLNLDSPFGIGAYTNLSTLLDRVDTLEVKEVDLEKKEIIDKACWWLNNNRIGVTDDDYIKEFRKAINN